MKTILTAMTLVILMVAGCTSDLPTTPLQAENSASLDKAILTGLPDFNDVVFEGFATDVGFIDCVNDGQGEIMDLEAYIRWITKGVVTPSGHLNWTSFIEEMDMVLTGRTTGDVWRGTGIGHVTWHVKADGRTLYSEPLRELFTKDGTGARLRLLTLFKMNGAGDVTVELKACSLFGPK